MLAAVLEVVSEHSAEVVRGALAVSTTVLVHAYEVGALRPVPSPECFLASGLASWVSGLDMQLDSLTLRP